MADIHILEDQAVLYVMGQLTTNERREFEARMAESVELRSLVRELEEGTMVLSATSPRRRPPQEIWTRIEKAVAGETGGKVVIPAFWVGWWRNGWAAAAACLVGWLLYALWVNHSNAPATSMSSLASSTANSQLGITLENSHPAKNDNAARQASAGLNPAFQLFQAKTQEISAMRWRIAELSNQMAHMSQALTQQQALLIEPDRIKFFQLVPATGNSDVEKMTPISTNLQRALFLAMARELGWSKTGSDTSEKSAEEKQTSGSSNPAPTNQSGVDFVDLHPVGNSTSQPQIGSGALGESDSPPLASSLDNTVPGFLSGTNAVLAFDSSVVPTGSSLAFWAVASGQTYQLIGHSVLGNNPQIVTIPFSDTALAGWSLAVTATTAAGSLNFIGQFPAPGTTPP